MLIKKTNRLFNNKYQYKIVLVVAGAAYFRDRDIVNVYQGLEQIDLDQDKLKLGHRQSSIKHKEDLDYALKLQHVLSTMKDYDIRIEIPWISIYANDKNDVDRLINLDSDKVKYVCEPPANQVLSKDTIILNKINHDYRITLGKTSQDHTAFIDWASTNKKLKLTKGCIKELSKSRSWGGTYFYVTGENNLLMAKMHLGDAINKIDRIVKAL
jgi:hypothetical protein